MRTVISNNEQTDYIRKRQPFVTRPYCGYGSPLERGGVYQGILHDNGTYELWHWSTLIATFYPNGAVYLNPHPRTATTNRYRNAIIHAMNHGEWIVASASAARALHAEARRYPRLHSDRDFRELLSRYDWALDYAHRYDG